MVRNRPNIPGPPRTVALTDTLNKAVAGTEGGALMLGRVLSLLYGAASYLIFAATFLYGIAFVGDLRAVAPRTIDLNPLGNGESLWQRITIDGLLLVLFGMQHSVMARQWFKEKWTRIIPAAAERSTYVLAASLSLMLLYWYWRPIGGESGVWEIQNATGRILLIALFWAGWGIALVSTLLIDHLDLFGLKQVYCYARRIDYSPPAFRSRGLYNWVRHPIYLGTIVAYWSTPRMSVGHLLFAMTTTGYILLAIRFEERDLIRHHGKTYANYRKQVSMLTPVLGVRSQVSGARSGGAGVSAPDAQPIPDTDPSHLTPRS
jgi:protein-S-isoprenylcysteine O-methyltransferase Ste14